MELSRLAIKLFVADSASIRLKDFVPIFHSWIQKQCVQDHMLIDVHDYSHIHHGPGILLVAHEGNFSTDMAEGKLGLTYSRKQPAGKTLEDELRAALKFAQQAALLIEAEPHLEGRMRFRKDELLVISNDRLLAPNDGAVFETMKPALFAVFGKSATLTHASAGTKDRLTIRVTGIAI
jgi:hypothetical protein